MRRVRALAVHLAGIEQPAQQEQPAPAPLRGECVALQSVQPPCAVSPAALVHAVLPCATQQPLPLLSAPSGVSSRCPVTGERTVLLAVFVCAVRRGRPPSAAELCLARAKVLALGRRLREAPVVRDEQGRAIALGPGDRRAIFFDALEYEGRATRAYALVSIPASASPETPVPGIVLVHGGGGSAFQEWVDLWAERGYAAISIAVEGQTDAREPREDGRGAWLRHEWAGPSRVGIYGDMAKPLADQWMYHAVADTVMANSLLRSVPAVNAGKVGVMGISWGGVVTSTVIGIDSRFAFAIPTYGCGHKFDSANQYGAALGGM